jgi:hypothetical protein
MWEFSILEANLPALRLDSLAAADLDGDGAVELVTGGDGLYWYRPLSHEWGLISAEYSHVGVVIGDIDGDGKPEIVLGQSKGRLPDNRATKPFGLGLVSTSREFMIRWFKPGRTLRDPWTSGDIDPGFEGHVHDILIADMDSDGAPEIVAISCYSDKPGIFIFKRAGERGTGWKKHSVSTGIFTEGLSIGDLDGDGRLEIVCGPDLYTPPTAGPFAGPWRRTVYAPSLREMCRTAIVDIAGGGRPDIVIVESEFMDGRLSRFLNPGNLLHKPWQEQRLLDDVVYGHSLDVHAGGGATSLMVAEMQQGGWNAPYNHGARVFELRTADRGATWTTSVIGRGEGTHQAILTDIDGDGEKEVVGKDAGFNYGNPRLHAWKRTGANGSFAGLRHRLIDRDKPSTGVEIIAVDVDGDGLNDLVCGSWWYHNPGWERREIPGIVQVINAFDIDGDGRGELIAIPAPASPRADFYQDLSSALCWVKPIDPCAGRWEIHSIGTGSGDWPHGSVLGPFGREGRLALAVAYHSAYSNPRHWPEIFEAPMDPRDEGWRRRTLAKIQYNEEMLHCDVAGSGRPDIIAGPWWLENLGDGSFAPHRYAPEGIVVGRMGLMDIAGNGRLDVVIGQEVADWEGRTIPQSPLIWLERPADPRKVPWPTHVIDSVFCAHSIGVGDLDGDGESEIVCGEHNPFWPYRSRCRLMIFKKADSQGRSWKKYTLDDRFEHHVGAKVFEISPGRLAIASHGWKDSIYVHLWEPGGR